MTHPELVSDDEQFVYENGDTHWQTQTDAQPAQTNTGALEAQSNTLWYLCTDPHYYNKYYNQNNDVELWG